MARQQAVLAGTPWKCNMTCLCCQETAHTPSNHAWHLHLAPAKEKCGFGWLLGLLWCFSCILAHMYSQVCIRTFFGNVDATLPIQIGMTRDVRVSRFSRFCTQKVERSYPAECWHGRCSYSCDQNRRYAPDQA